MIRNKVIQRSLMDLAGSWNRLSPATKCTRCVCGIFICYLLLFFLGISPNVNIASNPNVKDFLKPIVNQITGKSRKYIPLDIQFFQEIKASHKSLLDRSSIIRSQSKLTQLLLIIPYRNRVPHLREFANRVPQYIVNKDPEVNLVKILVVDQNDSYPFMRGNLINAGFKVAMDAYPSINWVCINDVDMVPVSETSYRRLCADDCIVHLASQYDRFNWTHFYELYIGGVACFTPGAFRKINGMSAQYIGYGAEDDDFFARAQMHGFVNDSGYPIRPADGRGRFVSLSEDDHQPRPHYTEPVAARNIEKLKCTCVCPNFRLQDGLSTTEFDVVNNQTDLGYFWWLQVSLHLAKRSCVDGCLKSWDSVWLNYDGAETNTLCWVGKNPITHTVVAPVSV